MSKLPQMPREFFVPKGALKVADKLSDAIAYIYMSGTGRPAAKIYYGKQNKPVAHYNYRTEAEREKSVTRYFEGRRAHLKRVSDARAEQTAFKHGVQVGDIFRTSWGYDQTNVEFYEITEVKGKHAILRRVNCAVGNEGAPQERVVPQSGDYCDGKHGEPFRRLIQKGYSNEPNIRIHECAMGYPWGTRGPGGIVIGEPCSRTGSGWGH